MGRLVTMVTLVLSSLILHLAAGTVYYVDQNKEVVGDRDGSWDAPFDKISKCTKKLSSAGDECQIRAGVYHEDIKVTGVRGEEKNPVIITGYRDERPVIDGTVEIKPKDGVWERDGEKYYGEIKETIWQLFVGETMMTNARWPNALWSDKTVFVGDMWAQVGTSSHIDNANAEGTIENRGSALKDVNIDMTGAMAVLNIGKWNTFVSKVKHHDPKDNFFTYHHTFGEFEIETKLSRYFLEDKADLLDMAEEWHFDKHSKNLAFIPPKGTDMDTAKLRGKVQTYAMTITDSTNLLIKNLDFFATTIKASSSSKTNKVDKITFDSLKFNYPSYSKRMLGELGLIEWTDIDGKFPGKECCGSFRFINNFFYGSDGVALAYHGEGSLLENNYFEYNDWTSANMLRYGGGMATIYSDSKNDLITRNTLVNNGNGCGIRPGRTTTITLNYITGQCFGFQQNDGAGIQVTRKPQELVHIENNWVRDSPKYGIRFDGERPKIGYHGSVVGNVVFKTNGIVIKGDYHEASKNLVFEASSGGNKPEKCSLCVWKTVRRNLGIINEHTIVLNNIADKANGGVIFVDDEVLKIDGVVQTWPLQGEVVENNIIGEPLSGLLVDVNNLDFRPIRKKEAAVDGVGPYKVSSKFYWIPGRQVEKASTPVPPNGSLTVKVGRRFWVMWLNALGYSTHQVYFGESKEAVDSATTTSDLYLGERKVESNMMKLPYRLSPGDQYFWRVDAVHEGSEVVKGDVWSFTTI